MNTRNIAKRGNFACNQNCGHCRFGEIVNGHKYCNVIDDYVDVWSGYICPKKDSDMRYCKKLDTYCLKENNCDKCPIE